MANQENLGGEDPHEETRPALGRCVTVLSPSNTWNVAKLTLEMSSSSIACWLTGANAAGSISGFRPPVAAHAPLASDNDRPVPSTGTALLRRFR